MNGVGRKRFYSSRSVLALTDQVMSGGGNYLVIVLATRDASAQDFGRFAVVFTVAMAVLGTCRAAFGEPLLLGAAPHEGLLPGGFRSVVASVAGAAVLILVDIVLGPGSLSWSGAALAGGLPLLVLLDMLRHAAMARQDYRELLLIDFCWAALQVAAFVGLRELGQAGGVVASAVAWSAGGAGTVVLLLVTRRAGVATRASSGGASEIPRAFRAVLVFDFLAGVGSSYVLVWILAVSLGTEWAGAFRGADVLVAPITAASYAARTRFAVPIAAAAVHEGARATLRLGLFASALPLPPGLATVGLLLVLPESILAAVFGADVAAGVSRVMIALAISRLLAASAVGPSLVLRGLGQGRALVALRLTGAGGVVVVGLVGPALGGVTGALWLLVIVNLGMLVLSFALTRAAASGWDARQILRASA